jgi:ribonuclease P protein subunit RPR2
MKNKPSRQSIVEQIKNLFKRAEDIADKKPDVSKRTVKKARAVGMKHRVHMPKEVKHKYCKKCNTFLKPGVNCTIRLNQKKQPHRVITCKECGAIMRVPYKK